MRANRIQIQVGSVGCDDRFRVQSLLHRTTGAYCTTGRPHLLDSNWTQHAVAKQHYQGEAIRIPVQYETGFEQLGRNLELAAEMELNA